MLKNNFKNWKTLSKKEQKTINGGGQSCSSTHHCVATHESEGCEDVFCINNRCVFVSTSCI